MTYVLYLEHALADGAALLDAGGVGGEVEHRGVVVLVADVHTERAEPGKARRTLQQKTEQRVISG